jgi:hypothetical protein
MGFVGGAPPAVDVADDGEGGAGSAGVGQGPAG